MFDRERGIPIVSEAWLIDSIENGEPPPLDDYDISRDLVVEARAILGDKEDTLESEVAHSVFSYLHKLIPFSLSRLA